MKENSINEKIFLAVKQNIPKDKTVANVLMDLFSLSRESIYRRLRGDIPFTLDELVKISGRFGISIDDLIDSGIITTKWATLDLDKFYLPENYVKQYCERLNGYVNLFQQMQSAKKASIRCAHNHIPYIFRLSHKHLCQLWHYKWNFMMKGANPNFTFSCMLLPDELIQAEKRFIEEYLKVPRTTLVLDKDIFLSIVSDIRFFVSQKLISQHELSQLKQELLQVISKMEVITDTGYYENGEEVTIYLSKINIDSCYYYAEFDDKSCSFQQTFLIDRLRFSNSKYCKKQKEWIDSLKKFSILLTQSGDRQRFEFFDEQRRLVKSLA